MNKFIKILLTFGVVLTLTSIAKQANADENNNYDSDIERIYQQGKDKGILTDDNMPFEQFSDLMKDSVIPAYESNKEDDNFNQSLDDFTADDNYEVSKSNEDYTEVNGYDPNSENKFNTFFNTTSATSGYSMKAGDILICYGSNSSTDFPGHAAIAKSRNEVLHMPGPNLHAQKWTKKHFFTEHTNGSQYVEVYRPSSSSDGLSAANFAYNKMYYGNTNPKYSVFGGILTNNFFDINPSYCSKYVILAYYYGTNTKNTMKNYLMSNSIVEPHHVMDHLNGKHIHRINKY